MSKPIQKIFSCRWYNYCIFILRRKFIDDRIPRLTTLLQGDLDTTGKIFDRAVASFKANETEYIIKKWGKNLNAEGREYASHMK